MADNIRTDGLMGGDRVYKGKGLGELTVWKCPSCATENTGPLPEGCTACGAGSAQPRHVGVPPPPPKFTGFKTPEEHQARTEQLDTMKIAFEKWYRGTGYAQEKLGAAELSLMLDAWINGVAWYRGYLRNAATVTDEPAPGEDPNIVAVPREVLNAVLDQLENTVDLPETESQSPALLALINRIRELLEHD